MADSNEDDKTEEPTPRELEQAREKGDIVYSAEVGTALSLIAATAIVAFIIHQSQKFAAFLFLFLCTLSHGILDAFTDGGLGITFFSPFSNTRYFFPWRPLEVSPIGISGFLSGPALSVLMSEIKFIWIPCGLIFLFGRGLKWQNTKQ